MGEIIIKVPGDVREVVEITEIDNIIKLFKELEKMKKQDETIDFILKNSGKLPKDFKVSEDELHLQCD